MNSLDTRSFEKSIAILAEDIIVTYRDLFIGVGLEASISLRRSTADSGSDDSELRVDFRRERGLVDALETYIVQRGECAISKSQVQVWLHEGITSVVSRQEHLKLLEVTSRTN